MANHVNTAVATPISQAAFWKDAALVVSATAFLAACAHVSLPLLFSPVPLSLQNFGVLVVALVLGKNRAAAALSLYLLEGAAGLPVFAPSGLGGVAQLLGPTGGFLLAYPAVAYAAGLIFDRLGRNVKAALLACAAAEVLLFASGFAWFRATVVADSMRALQLAVLPFMPGEVLKVAAASAIAARWQRVCRSR
jgi:biotin transport system substrate-specific component